MIIDWKKIALDKYDKMKDDLQKSWKKLTLQAILVWNNSASLRYISQKRKWADYVWITFELIHLDENIWESVLLDIIDKSNNDKNINGILVQLPLPDKIDSKKVINSIYPNKDVDWFHPVNQWKILIWDESWLVPCTPSGVMQIFRFLNIDLSWKLVVVIGRSNIVWKPLVALLINSGATTICCNSKTKDLQEFTKKADIVICAAGSPGLLKMDMINDKTVVIDVWFTIIDEKIYWDACFSEINENGNLITPVPGWVWTLTVVNIMTNVIKAEKLQNK